jgi:hypothetical protein
MWDRDDIDDDDEPNSDNNRASIEVTVPDSHNVMMILMCSDRSSYYDIYKQNEGDKLRRED